MVLGRLVVRLDRRLVAGALGIAAAILLPAASTLVLSGLGARVNPTDGWLAYRLDGGPMDLASFDGHVRAAVVEQQVPSTGDPGARVVAYVAGGNGLVAADEVRPVGTNAAPPAAVLRLAPTLGEPVQGPLLVPGTYLVAAARLPSPVGSPLTQATVALLDAPLEVPGVTVVPARGADAFEGGATVQIKAQTAWLLVGSVPAVALVAATFGLQEAREQRRNAATLVALGSARWARLVLAGRVLVVSSAGMLVAVAIAFGLWASGPPFHPSPTPKGELALAFLVPFVAALVAGVVASQRRSLQANDLLRSSAGAPAERHLPLPAVARPLLLGASLVPALFLTGLLFAFDVGFPLATAQVPIALVGGPGEFVFGGQLGLRVGVGVDAGVASVAGLDPAVQAIVAETPVPTLVNGEPTVVRGGSWVPLASYHGLRLVEGSSPGLGQAVVGDGLARRLGLAVGDLVRVQGGNEPWLQPLRIVGRATGPDLLNDELMVSLAEAGSLSGIPANQAGLVRFRPETDEARAAVTRTDPLIVVAHLQGPTGAVAGDLDTASITLANLGSQEGSRVLTLRVNGQGVATVTARLAGHETRTLLVPFLVPAGPFDLAVNPTTSDTAAPAATHLVAPASVVLGEDFTARLLDAQDHGVAGVRLGLFADSSAATARQPALASATTGPDGSASLRATRAGDAWLGTMEGPRAFTQMSIATTAEAHLNVTSVWSVPPSPQPGEEAHLFATVRNEGGRAGSTIVHFFAGNQMFSTVHVTLEAGASTTLSARLLLSAKVDTLAVENVTADLRTVPGSAASAPPPEPSVPVPPAPGGPAQGEALQASAANQVLGNAQAALGGIAATALASTLSIVFLATDRSLRSRSHVSGILEALGEDEGSIRRRAAAEAAALGALCLVAALVPAKALFALGHLLGRPAPFGHAVADPFGWLLSLQTAAAFAGGCALAAFLAAGPVLRHSPLRPSTRATLDALPRKPRQEVVEGVAGTAGGRR